jgi:hypothetical protein
MDCMRIQSAIDRAQGGACRDPAVAAHLASCQACAAFDRGRPAWEALLRPLREEAAPAGLRTRILQRTAARVAERQAFGVALRRSAAGLLLAMAAAGFLGFALSGGLRPVVAHDPARRAAEEEASQVSAWQALGAGPDLAQELVRRRAGLRAARPAGLAGEALRAREDRETGQILAFLPPALRHAYAAQARLGPLEVERLLRLAEAPR